jgi:WD40 repeat protein
VPLRYPGLALLLPAALGLTHSLFRYDEWVDKRMKCCADRCQGEGWEYGIANAFSMEKWERRMEKVSSNKTATAETGDSHTAPILGVKYNSLGSLLATCSEDNTVRIWDLKTREQLRRFNGHTAPVSDLGFNPDGRTIASCGSDGLLVWDVQTGATSLRGEHTAPLTAVAFGESREGTIVLAGSSDGNILVWDVKEGKVVGKLEGHKDKVR